MRYFPHKRFHDAPRSRQQKPSAEFQRFFNGPELWASAALWHAFQKWRDAHASEDYARFHQDYNAGRDAARAEMDSWVSPFINARKGEPYEISFTLPECALDCQIYGLEKAGLISAPGFDARSRVIRGTPKEQGDYNIRFVYTWRDWAEGLPPLTRDFRLLVNPDPRDLWEDIPSDQAQEYGRPDLEYANLDWPGGKIWAASRRGRSHAHIGAPRDDSFCLGAESGWQIIAVSDGAGSAQFSRKGAEIACDVAIAASREKLAQNRELDSVFLELSNSADPASWQAKAKKLAYNVLANAAFAAHKAIRQEADARGRETKEYATTLLLAMAKKFPAGWAVLSFQVGDGAMAMFADAGALLLAKPDEGEYGGQTRFVTMNEIFDPHELMRRLRVDFVSHLEGLALMTDGVSDARFVSQESLGDAVLWREFWREVLPLAQGPTPRVDLLEWLNFWSRGNHDDRTLALLATEPPDGF